jgi:hypothetical protein
MHTFGGKTEQQLLSPASQALPSHLLMSLNTESVHDPVLGRRAEFGAKVEQHNH